MEFEFPRSMTQGIRNTLEADIHGNCTWIMGYPGETLAQLQTSIGFIKWQQELVTEGLSCGTDDYDKALASINTSVFTATAYPGTEMFQHPRVRAVLSEVFGLRFDAKTGQPIADENLRQYVLELNDATKMITNNDGRPLNYSGMDDDLFVEVREKLDARELDAVLGM